MWEVGSCPFFCKLGILKIIDFTMYYQYEAVIQVAHGGFWTCGTKICQKYPFQVKLTC